MKLFKYLVNEVRVYFLKKNILIDDFEIKNSSSLVSLNVTV